MNRSARRQGRGVKKLNVARRRGVVCSVCGRPVGRGWAQMPGRAVRALVITACSVCLGLAVDDEKNQLISEIDRRPPEWYGSEEHSRILEDAARAALVLWRAPYDS